MDKVEENRTPGITGVKGLYSLLVPETLTKTILHCIIILLLVFVAVLPLVDKLVKNPNPYEFATDPSTGIKMGILYIVVIWFGLRFIYLLLKKTNVINQT